MAVSSLKKLSVIAEKSHLAGLLQLVQGTQHLEVEDLFANENNQDWLEQYFPAGSLLPQAENPVIDQLQSQITESIQFIRDHGDAKQKTVELKRKETTLAELEERFNQQQLEQELHEILALKQTWETNQQQNQKYQAAEDWGTDWQGLDISLQADQTSKLTETFFGLIANEQWEPLREKLATQGRCYFEVVNTSVNETAFALLFLHSDAKEIQEIMQAAGAKQEISPYQKPPKEVLAEAKENLARLATERKELAQAIGAKKANVADLQLAEEVLLARKTREEAKEKTLLSKHLCILRGWVAEDDIPSLTQKIAATYPNNEVYLSFEEPTKEEIGLNRLPIKLKNSGLIKPFEMLTEMYSLPKYDEIDPTPWMMPFYLVFFGMMVADAGYGALMLIGTTVASRMTLAPGVQRFMKLFQILSVSTIIWGLIYGSCFGINLPFRLLSPSKDFMAIFGISMVFAGIQIFTGLFLAARENIRRKDYLSAINQGFSWQGILAGILVAAAGQFVVHSSALTTLGIALAGFSALFVVIIPMIQGESKVGGFFMGLYELYGVTGYIGDFVSYSRLMALGISGGSIAAAFNMLVDYMPPAAKFTVGIILIIVLQGLNIFLSLLSAYVHAARLQYVEFFGKFYTGGGRAFNALKPAAKYLNFKEDGGNKE